jgi:hypothetical protein
MRIFDLHISKARYDLKMVLLHLWRVNVKTTGGFIYISLENKKTISLEDFNMDKIAP